MITSLDKTNEQIDFELELLKLRARLFNYYYTLLDTKLPYQVREQVSRELSFFTAAETKYALDKR